MDERALVMGINTIYLGETERRRRRVFPVKIVGCAPTKNHRVVRSFNSFNYSFILGGSGDYYIGNRRIEVEAPCVIIQWPDVWLDYGPIGKEGRWDEIYFLYPKTAADRFADALMVDPREPHWQFEMTEEIRSTFRKLGELTRAPLDSNQAERIDLLCEQIVMLTRPDDRKSSDPAVQRIERIRRSIEAGFLEIRDVDEVARRAGLSRSTFRRQWVALYTDPPTRLLIKLRMRHACRLLVETQRPIGEIGGLVGYDDPLYFSRKFRETFDCTATEFRERNRLP